MKGDCVLCIVGPTASGKSALADELACRLATSVISVDAMQVYRGMDIGTAKTPVSERRRPLLMVDVADIGDAYSAQLFQEEVRSCIDSLCSEGKLPILCGGTGLYLDATIDDMVFPKGDTSSETRKRYEKMAEDEGNEAIYALLESRDPASAELIHPNNVRRVIRALELLDEGKSYAVQHAGLHERAPWYNASIWGIAMDRERLYRRISVRVDQMLQDGLVDEVEGLVAAGFRDTLTAMQAIGYKEIVDYLEGSCTLPEATEEIKKRTRRYAKRQLSWFKRDGRVKWLDLDQMDTKGAADMIMEKEML
ncbi:MAG: tRNA (adenosine(37)-N6)-dimethylallyltransferase MiaA [Atopobiaceae bacterium]|nr:tRNA (adenosine(37)-N6)-dimethylallyltransferase MiaA [Atopobiaceae bacterium]